MVELCWAYNGTKAERIGAYNAGSKHEICNFMPAGESAQFAIFIFTWRNERRAIISEFPGC